MGTYKKTNIAQRCHRNKSPHPTTDRNNKINARICITNARNTKTDMGKLEVSMPKCVRQINEPYWVKRNKLLTKTLLYRKYKIPTIKTWMRKLDITNRLRQTAENWDIHTENQYKTKENEQICQQNGKSVKIT